jgi:hypothetical protein
MEFSKYNRFIHETNRKPIEDGNEAPSEDRSNDKRENFTFTKVSPEEFTLQNQNQNITFHFKLNDHKELELYQFQIIDDEALIWNWNITGAFL